MPILKAKGDGADGAGQTAMGKTFKLKALSSPEVQNMTDSELFDTIAKGKGKMNNLGYDNIHPLVGYIRTLGKKNHTGANPYSMQCRLHPSGHLRRGIEIIGPRGQGATSGRRPSWFFNRVHAGSL